MEERIQYAKKHADDKTANNRNHKVNMSGRKNISLTGIVDVISFDASEVLLESTLGDMVIKGDELHITGINLEKGETDIEGRIDGIIYNDPTHKKSGSFLGRIFG